METKPIKKAVLKGTISIPPSKSVTHRLLIINALSNKTATLIRPLVSEDTVITAKGLQTLGYQIKLNKNNAIFNRWNKKTGEKVFIDVKNSGTSARLLTAVASISGVNCVIDGSERMRQRPMKPIIEALTSLGASLNHNQGYLPISLQHSHLRGGIVEIDATKSSQFVSAIALIAPLLPETVTIRHRGKIASKPYLDLTLSLMQIAGIEIRNNPEEIVIPGVQTYTPVNTKVEGDFSSAGYFLVGAAITGGKVRCKNINADSVQGDKIILEILKNSGARITVWEDNIEVRGGSELNSIDFDMQNYPDLVPTVAVLSLFARGKSHLRNVLILRFKESDRIRAIIENIGRLGGNAFLNGPDLIIKSGRLKGALLDTYSDHRIAMSFALAGLKIPGVKIFNPECVHKSYPNFWIDLKKLSKLT
jgi:3-phosphoshikimate 1-carboxyvinyltransferase